MSYAIVWDPYYDSEWDEPGEWGEAILNLPNNWISYDEAVAQLS